MGVMNHLIGRGTGGAWALGVLMLACPGLDVNSAHASGAVRYVDATAPTGGDGSSWEAAFPFLSDALANAAGDPNVTEIRIAQGRYVPDRSAAARNGTGDRALTFLVPTDVAVIGGFAGRGIRDPDAWDPVIFETVLDGDLNGDDDPETGLLRGDNAWTVVHVPVGGPGTRLSGLTMRGGYGNGPSHPPVARRGGGLNVSSGDAVIQDCRFEDNYAWLGGGIYLGSGSHLIERSVFDRNGHAMTTWSGRGGGISKGLGEIEIIDSTFVGNGAENGGAVSVQWTDWVWIDGSYFEANISSIGGAVRVGQAQEAAITRSHFIGNAGSPGPSAIFSLTVLGQHIDACTFIANVGSLNAAVAAGSLDVDVTCRVSNSVFIMNSSTGFGGGLGIANGEIVNCLFSRNTAPQGSALYASDRVKVINSTFYGHVLPLIQNEGTEPGNLIANCVIHSPVPGPSVEVLAASPHDLAIHDSIVSGEWYGAGANILDVNPLFRNPGVDDLRLLKGSPAIDAGDNDWLPREIVYDLDGQPRIQNGIVDMGCYEGVFDAVAQATSIPYVPAGAEVVLALEGGLPSVWTKRVVRVQNLTNVGASPTIITELPSADVAPGGNPLRAPLQIETDMPAGSLLVRVSMPFTAEDLDGVLPAAADLMGVHPDAGRWVRAPFTNADAMLGTRVVRLDGVMPAIPFSLGAYGLGWDPAAERGFVAAMLDGPGIFAPVVPTCPADAAGIPDAMVNWSDLLFIVAHFGTGWGPADVNADGVVDLDDLTQALSNWGPCP